MLVVIPTFNRVDRLRWTLLSLMQAELPDCSERFLVCLANNHPATEARVHVLIAEVKSQNERAPWEWCLFNWEKTANSIDTIG